MPQASGPPPSGTLSGETDPAAALAALLSRAERAGLGAAPVERWNPAHCGDIDMAIRADGSWHYNGSPIGRPALVRLFSTVLTRDADGRFYLVTPAEKLGLLVEDAPFTAVELAVDPRAAGPVLVFRTNVGDVVEAGPDHPLRFEAGEAGFRPYLLVRGRLEARLTRALAFDLAELAEEAPDGSLSVISNGARFALPPVEAE